jgi:hypothetical protein
VATLIFVPVVFSIFHDHGGRGRASGNAAGNGEPHAA